MTKKKPRPGQSPAPGLPWHVCLDLAAQAGVDPRSIQKRSQGLPVRGRAGAKADAVLAEREAKR